MTNTINLGLVKLNMGSVSHAVGEPSALAMRIKRLTHKAFLEKLGAK